MTRPRRLVTRTAAVLTAAGLCLGAGAQAQEAPPSAGSADAAPACRDVRGVERPDERVVCRTATKTLVIAPEDIPVMLGGTQVRVIDATLEGATLRTRLRVRNETEAEQGLSAGGQELYLHLDGERIDARPIGVVRVPRRTGVSASVLFDLSAAQLERLRALGGRIDFGVRPWEQLGHRLVGVGVVRLDVAAG